MKCVVITSAIPSLTDDVGMFGDNLARLLRSAGESVLVIAADARQEQNKASYQRWVSDLQRLGIDVVSVFDTTLAVPPGYDDHVWIAELVANLVPSDTDIVYLGERDARGLHITRSRRFSPQYSPTFVTVLHGGAAWLRETRAALPSGLHDIWLDFSERYQTQQSDFIVSPGHSMLDWVRENNWALPQPERQRVLSYPLVNVALNVALEELGEPQAVSVQGGMGAASVRATGGSEPDQDHVQTPPVRRIVFWGPLDNDNGFGDFTDAIQDLQVSDQLENVREITLIGTRRSSVSGRRDDVERLKQIVHAGIVVKVIPDPDQSDLREYLAQHKQDTLVVLFDRQANYSYMVVEVASVEGLRVIAANVGSNAEILGRSRDTQLFEPSHTRLTEKIGELLRQSSRHATQTSEPGTPSNHTLPNQLWLDFHSEVAALAQARRTTQLQTPTEPGGGDQSADQSPERQGTTRKSVDICIAYYNLGDYLPYTLDSLSKQTCHDFNVFVIDDGSTSPEAVKTFDQLAHSYERLGWQFVTTANGGVSAARNASARLGDADYIMFVDADDVVAPTLVERFLTAIRQSGDDCLTCYMQLFRGDGWRDEFIHQNVFRYTPSGNAPLLGLTANPFGGSCCIIRRSVFEAIGGFTTDLPKHTGAEDFEFFTRLSLKGFKLDVVPETLYYYRVRFDGRLRTTNQDPYLRYANHMRVMRNYELALRTIGLDGLAPFATGISSQLIGSDMPFAPDSLFRPNSIQTGDAQRTAGTGSAWQQQRQNWERAATARTSELNRLQAWTRELQEALAWHQQQSQNWERAAAESETELNRLQAWTRELQEALAWHQQQSQNWERTAAEREALIRVLQAESGIATQSDKSD